MPRKRKDVTVARRYLHNKYVNLANSTVTY